MITITTYREYLIRLKNKMFKALCLYEEESATFDKFFNSLIYYELTGLKHWINELPHDIWYVETLSRLKAIDDEHQGRFNDVLIVKAEIFGIMKLIDKQIDSLKGV